jgi:glycosyltransferase involved in cell wall biosynthesis
MTRPLRIAQVAPVATSVPPPRSGSIELLTAQLTEGLVARGHAVTLFATGDSVTRAALHATFARGYRDEPALWPWELAELMNLAAAVERAGQFDLIHCQSEYYPMSLAFGRLVATPVLHTVHYAPADDEVAMWRRYPEAPFVAVSAAQARRLHGLRVVGTVPHAVDTDALSFQAVPGGYLLFLGRFTEGKGVLEAIEVARRAGLPLRLAAEANDYYRDVVAPQVDGTSVVYAGEVSGADKAALLGGARALVYPLQAPESFGLVLAEAMACGTPVAALDCGAVGEVVDHGVTGGVFPTLDALVAGLPGVLALDRHAVRAAAVARFGLARMIAAYETLYHQLADGRPPGPA